MSSQTTGLNTNNALFVNTDVSKVFLRNNRYQKGQELNNSTYDPLNMVAGTLMGRVTSTGRLAPFNAAASDGSQVPIGVLAEDVSLDSGELKTVTIVDGGDIASDKVAFVYSGQGLETAVTVGVSRRTKDLIQDMGIKLIEATEMTAYDNQ